MSGDSFDPKEFASAFARFLTWVEREGETGDGSPFASTLSEHFGVAPSTFPVTSKTTAAYDLPNVQVALEAYLDRPGVSHRLLGFGGPIDHFDLSLSGLVHDVEFGLTIGPVRRTVVQLEEGRPLTCVTAGLFLIDSGGTPLAVLVGQGERGFDEPGLRIEVMAAEAADGEAFLAELRALMAERNVYRGKVLELQASDDMGEGASVVFRPVPAVTRDSIVLPEGVLDTVELLTVEFAEHSDAMRASGQHLRRGILLHGPPGTGKTLTAGYVISRLEGRTVLIMSGGGLGLVGEACAMARELQPALVILEDVDLVASERTMGGPTSLLFELLNEMDGIGEDADVIFLMTTNRADLLEPALAARPGRVDQAIELPVPDEAGRERLLALFCQGLDADLDEQATIVARTDGASPAFLREVVRKAALFAARDGDRRVTKGHFDQAMKLLEFGGSVTRTILGADGGEALERLDEDGFDDIDFDDDFDDD